MATFLSSTATMQDKRETKKHQRHDPTNEDRFMEQAATVWGLLGMGADSAKDSLPTFFVFFLFFFELAAAIWGFGNGCGQCKRFTAHCGEANTMVLAFLSVGELCLIEMESFAPFLVDGWLPSWGRHCSKSQNRRKCEGNGSNLQHLKDNWPAGPPPHCWRKSIVKWWMSHNFSW